MKSSGCAKPTIELVKTGPSLILKFKEMAVYLCRHLFEFQNEALSTLDQLSDGCDTPPTFPLAPLDFEY